MRLYSYIVARDFGFAPNPFHGCCTLATCKPQIRASASVGDWIIGTGAKTKYRLTAHLIYAMTVHEVLTFDSYWQDVRFRGKRPVLNGSLKQLYGDNIYHRTDGHWLQADSHHSLADGAANQHNVVHDTRANRVLIGWTFAYFGNAAPLIPSEFRPYAPTDEDVCCPRQGHRVFSEGLAVPFTQWMNDVGRWGVQGLPLEFSRHKRTALQATVPPGGA